MNYVNTKNLDLLHKYYCNEFSTQQGCTIISYNNNKLYPICGWNKSYNNQWLNIYQDQLMTIKITIQRKPGQFVKSPQK